MMSSFNRENQNKNVIQISELVSDLKVLEKLEKIKIPEEDIPLDKINFIPAKRKGTKFLGVFAGFEEYNFDNNWSFETYAKFFDKNNQLFVTKSYKFLQIPVFYIGKLVCIRYEGYMKIRRGRKLKDFTIFFIHKTNYGDYVAEEFTDW